MIVIVQPVFAAITLSFANVPASIDQSQDFALDVSLICSGCSSDSYIRGVFYPGGTSYFGFTQNNSGDWINAPGGNCTQYYKVAAADLSKEGTWSGRLYLKPDITSPYFIGPGDYVFKIARYTTSCSATWSSETTITITGPTPTATPAPTATPSNTPTPSSTCTPTPSRTPTPTKIPTATPVQTSAPVAIVNGEMAVLG